MLSWGRRTLLPLALCALLSLTLATAVALACPAERVTLEPDSYTFTSVGERRTFRFRYDSGAGDEHSVFTSITGSAGFVIPSAEDRCSRAGVRLRPGDSCELVVEYASSRFTRTATLRVDVSVASDTADLIGN